MNFLDTTLLPLYCGFDVDRVRFEMITDETGSRSYKLPEEEADGMLLLGHVLVIA